MISRKRRYYHYPSPVAIDRFNTQVLRALSIKLSRDYLGFFGQLSKLYTKGEQKKRLVSVVSKVKKSIALLDSMISVTSVSKNDVETLVESVEEINEARDYFLDQVEQNKSFEKRAQQISTATGISLQDLNITKEVIQKGAAQVRRRTREGVAPFLKRTAPGAIDLGAELGRGVVAAAMGPFAPIAGMAGTVLKGAYGIGAGIQEKRRVRQEEKLAGRLAPMAQGLKPAGAERLGRRRVEGPFVTGFGGISRRPPTRKLSKEELVVPLTYFFDKKAHKAKWTKEILNRFRKMEKGISKIKGGKGVGDLFGGLTKGMIPLIGKIALLTAGVGAAVLSFAKIKKAWDAFTGFQEAKKRSAESKKAMKAVAGVGPGTWEQELLTREDPIAALKQYTREGKISPEISQMISKRMTPEYVKAHKKTVQWTREAEEAKALTEKFSTGMGSRDAALAAMPTTIRNPFQSGSNEEIKQGMLGVQKAVEQVNDTLSRQQGPAVKGAGLGDSYGVGDPLMMGWANGQLSIGDE